MKRCLLAIAVTLFLCFLVLQGMAQGTPAIQASTAGGRITGCEGAASSNTRVITVSGSNLTAGIQATAPLGFEVSLDPASGYGGTIILQQAGGIVDNKTVYVRSSASAKGNIVGDVVLSSAGAADQQVEVRGILDALPMVNPVADQAKMNSQATDPINFTGTGDAYTWTNDNPGIGLPASGTGNISSFTAINSGTSAIKATITVTPVSLTYAYIANSNSGDVSVINTTSNAVVATIPVGGSPYGVGVSPDGKLVYVTNRLSNNVSVISTKTQKVITTIAVGKNPHGVAVNPDGNRLYVANSDDNTLSVINTAGNFTITTIPVGNIPEGVIVSQDGNRVYVTDYQLSGSLLSYLSVIDTKTNTVSATVTTPPNPNGMAINPLDGWLFIAHGNKLISAFDPSKLAVQYSIDVNDRSDARSLCISPNGSRLYVAFYGSNEVDVVSPTGSGFIAGIPVQHQPYGISMNRDGSAIYVTNNGSNTVSAINTADNSVTATIPVGSGPVSLGSFIRNATGCSAAPISFTITVQPSPPPAIAVAGTLTELSTTYGTPSSSGSFKVSGTYMMGGILVTPPAGFEVSTDNVTFSSTAIIGAAGTIAEATVYIRLTGTMPVGNYSGDIVLTSAGAGPVNEAMPNSKITPALLTITANDVSKSYGTGITGEPGSTAFISTGLQNLETIGSVTITYGVGAAATDAAGVYPGSVIASLATDGTFSARNYTINYVPGALTVTPSQAIVIPNAFTPNGDGINDTWNIKNLELYPLCTVNVFNRYGRKVFSSNGYGISWNGMSAGAILPAGSYFYIIDIKNGSKPYSGNITIIR